MKIVISVIPHNEQRYNTVGDWQFALNGDLLINVSDLGNDYYNYLVARHEMDEAILCRRFHVDEEEVTKYDLANPDTAGNDTLSDNLDSPYFDYHNDALASEWQFGRLLGVDWADYTLAVERRMDDYLPNPSGGVGGGSDVRASNEPETG
jgi:hypothetical protein